MNDLAGHVLKRIEYVEAGQYDRHSQPATAPLREHTGRLASSIAVEAGPSPDIRSELQQLHRDMQDLREQVRRLVEKQ